MTATNKLTDAIYALLPLINDVVHTHSTTSDSQQCRRCHVRSPCDHVETAIAALDLVLHVHVHERATHRPRNSFKPPHTEADDGEEASFLRGLQRAHTELIDRRISPDTGLALMVIIASVDIGRRTLAKADTPEMFNHGVLLGVLDRAIAELTNLDPQR